MSNSWAQFNPGYPTVPRGNASDDSEDVIRTSAEAPRTRNAEELSAQIKQAGGALVVSPNDSNYIVAVNNGLRFSVTKLENGQFRITESANWLIFIGIALFIGIAVLSRK